MSEIIQCLARDHRFDIQLALVREHWASVRHLWLDSSDCRAGKTIRSEIPPEFWLGCGIPGLARIRPIRDRRFEFAEDGRLAMIIPAYNTIPGLLGTNAEFHVKHIVDLVAVDLDHREKFWRHRGEALVLGLAYLEIAGQEGEPLPVFKNPMTWLKSGGAGVVILDWNWAWDLLLGFELIAEDVDLGNRLEAALKPSVWVMEAAA